MDGLIIHRTATTGRYLYFTSSRKTMQDVVLDTSRVDCMPLVSFHVSNDVPETTNPSSDFTLGRGMLVEFRCIIHIMDGFTQRGQELRLGCPFVPRRRQNHGILKKP
jgi:hypothetical protein